MKKLIYLTTVSLAIAALGVPATQAQQTPVPGPGGTPPGEITPGTAPAPGNTPVAGGTCPASVASTTPGAAGGGSTTTPYQAGADVETTRDRGFFGSVFGGGTRTDAVHLRRYTNRVNSYMAGFYATPPAGVASNTTTSTAGSGTGGGDFRTSATTTTQGVYTGDAPQLIGASSNRPIEHQEVGVAHFVGLYTGGSPLCYVSVRPLNAVASVGSVRAFDAAGQQLAISVVPQADRSAVITFNQPVPPRTIIGIGLQGLNYTSRTAPGTVLYSLSGRHADFNQEIPYGVAQIQRHLY